MLGQAPSPPYRKASGSRALIQGKKQGYGRDAKIIGKQKKGVSRFVKVEESQQPEQTGELEFAERKPLAKQEQENWEFYWKLAA